MFILIDRDAQAQTHGVFELLGGETLNLKSQQCVDFEITPHLLKRAPTLNEFYWK